MKPRLNHNTLAQGKYDGVTLSTFQEVTQQPTHPIVDVIHLNGRPNSDASTTLGDCNFMKK